jgi:hypothetical protein
MILYKLLTLSVFKYRQGFSFLSYSHLSSVYINKQLVLMMKKFKH